MSTLATNKIGTLAGTADMSLPTTRPSATKSAFLDSAGNLTFEETSIPVEFFVADGTAFVSSVLVDTAYLTSAGYPASVFTNSGGSSSFIYGVRLGMWNLSETIKTNYLFQKNLRWFELNAWGNGNADSSSYWCLNLLNPSGGLLYTQNQTMGQKHFSLDGNTSTSQGGNMTSQTWYSGAAGSHQYGGTLSARSLNSGSTEPSPWSVRTRIKAAVNYGFRIDAEGAIKNSDSYGPDYTYKTWCPRVDQPINSTNLDRGGPWADFGGFYFGTSQEASNYAPAAQFGSFVLKAQIKPTAVVTA